jgi:hypothetical protein
MRGMDDERRSRTAKGEIGGARENARVSGSVRNASRFSNRVPDARTRRPARASSAEHKSCLDRAPVRIDRRFDRADAVADRKRATDGGRCDRRTPPRASRSVRAGSGRRDASPKRETYHGVCAATVSRSRRTARVSRAARVCAGAEEDRATRVGSVRLRREIRDGSCMKSVTKYMYKGYKIDTVSKGCRMWCSVCVRAMLTKYQSHPETRLTSYRTSSCVSATSRPFSPPST